MTELDGCKDFFDFASCCCFPGLGPDYSINCEIHKGRRVAWLIARDNGLMSLRQPDMLRAHAQVIQWAVRTRVQDLLDMIEEE